MDLEEYNMNKYSINIQYDNIDNIYVASVPELEGCMAHGNTREEAMKEIQVAMQLWLEVAEECGDLIPQPLMRAS
jgi:predicted RNase H-like HicB family nuclease